MYAIIETGGKQYRVESGETIEIEKIKGEINSKIEFDNVLAISNDGGIEVGSPYIQGATVSGEFIDLKKGPKVTVFKMKRRKGYRRKLGHRQIHSHVKILEILKN